LLLERHGGQVPRTFEELEALPGVGHKTASVVMAQAFGVPAFPVDTHIHRLAQRWKLSAGRSVEQTERDLKAAVSARRIGISCTCGSSSTGASTAPPRVRRHEMRDLPDGGAGAEAAGADAEVTPRPGEATSGEEGAKQD
jgi:hypothetical protein